MESPISSQRRTAEETCEEFHVRMRSVVSLLESKNTIFFYKKMSRSMVTEAVRGSYAYCLKFPIHFLNQHGNKFHTDVTFGMKGSMRTWPIKLTIRSSTQVFAYGDGGWKTFLMDNQIKVGDILIFTLLSFSEFQVVIGTAPAEVHPDDDESNESSAKWFRNTWPWWNANQAPLSCRVCKQGPPCPRFLVTIRPSSHPRHLSLDVPGRFWELHRNMLECDDLQLRGPTKDTYVVKAQGIYDLEEEKLFVCLKSGWEAFYVANELRVGDILEFFLVAHSCFTVDLVERVVEN